MGKPRDNPQDRANNSGNGASEPGMTSAAGSIPFVRSVPARESAPSVRAAQHGWVVQIMKQEGQGILRMLWRLLGREADVLDAYQDCFCKLARRQGGQSDISSARAYVYRTASNIAVEMIRGRRRRLTHLPAIARAQAEMRPDQTPSGATSEGIERLREAIARLPGHLRSVVVLRDLSHLSYADVGRMLGIEPATARVYRRHAVVRLAEFLNESEEPK